MSTPTDPVEKVVETLFFHLVFQANPARPFVYASLSGNAEKRFGDALAYVGRVFVFEFKRSLLRVFDELGKFKRIPSHTEDEFGKKLDLCADLFEKNADRRFNEMASLIRNPPSGHYFVALRPDLFSVDQSYCQIASASDSTNLDIQPYLGRLRGASCESITTDQRVGVVRFVENSGMALDLAVAYFQLILILKTISKAKGGLGETDTLFACFAVDENGSVGISNCTGLQELSRLFEDIQKRNQLIRQVMVPDTLPRSRNTEKDRDDDAPSM